MPAPSSAREYSAKPDNQNSNEEALSEATLRHEVAKINMAMDSGNPGAALEVIENIRHQRDRSLYIEVGKLTRRLHEAIQQFSIHSIEGQTGSCSRISDASQRLNYVIKITEQAANQTLDRVAANTHIVRNIEEKGRSIRTLLLDSAETSLSGEQAYQLDEFLSLIESDAEVSQDHLNQILCAQEYQDLTAQALEHASGIISQVEQELVQLMRMASHVDRITGQQHTLEPTITEAAEPCGPQIEEPVSQDDVDDLLNSLGF